MVKIKVEHRQYKDGVKGLMERIAGIQKRHIYVGIPQDTSSRKDGEINNAELLYIHTHGIRRASMIREMEGNLAAGMKYSKAYELYIQSHGSPLWQSPPRPVIEPALEANKEKISAQFKQIYKAAAEGDGPGMDRAIDRTGLAAQNIVRGWFTDPRNNWAPNSPKTIKRKGSDRPLIDTGSLRKAITYVVRSD
nr:MAG TPA: virion morphogenesis protein [Caudoviricetes sp.]